MQLLLISGYVSFARPLIDQLVAVDPLTPLTRCMPGFADLMEAMLRRRSAPIGRCSESIQGTNGAALLRADPGRRTAA